MAQVSHLLCIFRTYSARSQIHDRDSIYSSELDSAVKSMGLSILKTPFRAPQANAFRERVVGTIRRDCLDSLIPLNERHLRRILKEWGAHYNGGRPHSNLGQDYPTLPTTYQSNDLTAIRFLIIIESWRVPFWLVSITNMDSRGLQRDNELKTARGRTICGAQVTFTPPRTACVKRRTYPRSKPERQGQAGWP